MRQQYSKGRMKKTKGAGGEQMKSSDQGHKNAKWEISIKGQHRSKGFTAKSPKTTITSCFLLFYVQESAYPSRYPH